MPGASSEHLIIDIFDPDDEAEVIRLWQECGLVVPWNNPQTDIKRKLEDSPELFFVGRLDGVIAASCMAGYDGHRGWVYFLAVARLHRRKGFAAKLMHHVEATLVELGCPKLELMVRESNTDVISFYREIGFDLDPVRILSKRLIEDEEHDF